MGTAAKQEPTTAQRDVFAGANAPPPDQSGPGTTVTTTQGEQQQEPEQPPRMAVGRIPQDVALQIELRRQRSAIAARLAGTNWGKGLDVQTRMAVADWAQRHGVDATTEIEVLGGNLYLKAQFYLNRLATLVERGVVEYAYSDHVAHDERLAAIATDEMAPEGFRKQAQTELYRRKLVRIEYGAPENARAVVVFRIKMATVPVQFTGCKWTGTGRKAKVRGVEQNYFADPIGEEFPVETAETRAARRAMRLLVNQVPEARNWIEVATDDAALTLTPVLERAHERSKIGVQEEADQIRPRLSAASYDDTPLPQVSTVKAAAADDPYRVDVPEEERAEIPPLTDSVRPGSEMDDVIDSLELDETR
jgi:hypothetical protein